MKNKFNCFVILLLVITSCAPVQEISRSWVKNDNLHKGPFHSIFILALVRDSVARMKIEDNFARLMSARGLKSVKSTVALADRKIDPHHLNKEKMASLIKELGCDAVFTVALLEVKSEKIYEKKDMNSEPPKQFYNPYIEYYPIGFGIYASYFTYYNYYDPLVYSIDNYVTERVYYFETNFYELDTDQLLWSIQSKAYNPTGLDSWLKGYSKLLISKLKKEGLIKK